jgi:antitoxin (DNA-binding transcriptional repressor) of toxin-antitoxin stability system
MYGIQKSEGRTVNRERRTVKIDAGHFVLQICSTMKTATVRQLRNQYSELLSWIAAGEEVLITRRGVAIARLIPERSPKERLVDWKQSAAFRLDRGSLPLLSANQAALILSESQGGD